MTDPADDILCGETGAPDGQRWSEPVVLSASDRAVVDALVSDGTLELVPLPEGARLAGTDRVGVVALPSGRRVCIRPKIGSLRLVEWLAYLGDCPPTSGSVRAGSGDVHDLLVAMYVGALEALTRAHVRREYARVHTASATVRGRVAVGALARGWSRLPAVPQTTRVRSPDTPHNRLLAAALDRVVPLAPAQDRVTRNRLAAMRDAWSPVPRPPGDIGPALAAARWTCPPGYGTAVQLASLVLTGSSPDLTGRGAAGPSFLVPLAQVWERAVRRMCHDLRDVTGWSPVPDAQRTRRWHDGPHLADPVRRMTADVILRSPVGARWVLDAKYKCDYGAEDRHDCYQVTAYATAFDAGRGTLVYPTGAGGGARRRELLVTDVVGGRRVTIDSVELPMVSGPAACRAALRPLLASTGAG